MTKEEDVMKDFRDDVRRAKDSWDAAHNSLHDHQRCLEDVYEARIEALSKGALEILRAEYADKTAGVIAALNAKCDAATERAKKAEATLAEARERFDEAKKRLQAENMRLIDRIIKQGGSA